MAGEDEEHLGPPDEFRLPANLQVPFDQQAAKQVQARSSVRAVPVLMVCVTASHRRLRQCESTGRGTYLYP